MPQNLKLSDFSNLYLVDRVADEDKFDHQDFSEILWRIIQDKTLTEDRTPFNIGIFGKWGVGKSTVVNLFRKELDLWNKNNGHQKKYEFIEFKIWKFSKEAIKRKFIFTIGRSLLGENKLDELNVKVRGQRVFQHSLLSAPDYLVRELLNWNKNKPTKWIKLGIGVFAAFVAAVFLFNLKFQWVHSFSDFFSLLCAFLIFQLPSAWAYICKAVNNAKIEISFDKYDSDEQFEEEFIRQVKDTEEIIKIIFIDDLDRCPDDKVVEALETIKTYLDVKTCVFIIACDDEVIKRVVESKRKELLKDGNASDYLNKFFQYTLRIPPFIHQNMRDYAKEILSLQKNDLLKLENVDDILEVLIHPGVVNPRKAISLINNFAFDFETILKREESVSSKLRAGDVSSQLPALAVFTVIKNDYSPIYDLLLRDNELLKYLTEDGKAEFGEEYHQKIIQEAKSFPDFAKFIYFLNGVTEFIRDVDDFTPFVYLDADKNSSSLKSDRQKDLYHFFKTGQSEKVKQMILENKDVERQVAHFEVIVDLLNRLKISREKKNGLKTIFDVVESVPDNLALGNLSVRIMAKFHDFVRTNEKWVEEFNLEGVMYVLQHLWHSKSTQQEVIGTFVDTLNKTSQIELAHKLVRAILKYEFLLTDPVVIQKVQNYIDRNKPVEANKELVWLSITDVANLVIEQAGRKQALSKFISAARIQEICDVIADFDRDGRELTDEEKTQLQTAISAFDIIDDILLTTQNRIKDRIASFTKLLPTKTYYFAILDRVKKCVKDIPADCVDSLIGALILEISSVDGDELRSLLDAIDRVSAHSELKPVQGLSSIVTTLPKKIFDEYSEENFQVGIEYVIKYSDGRLSVESLESILSYLVQKVSLASQAEYSRAAFSFFLENERILSQKIKTDICSVFVKELSDPNLYALQKFPNNEGFVFLKSVSDKVVAFSENKNQLVASLNASGILQANTVSLTLNQKSDLLSLVRSYFDHYDATTRDAFLVILLPYLTNANKDIAAWGIEQIDITLPLLKIEDISTASQEGLVRSATNLVKTLDGADDSARVLRSLLFCADKAKQMGGVCIAALLEAIELQFQPNRNHQLAFNALVARYDDFNLEKQVVLCGSYLGSTAFSGANTSMLLKKIEEQFSKLASKEEKLDLIDKYAVGVSLDERAWTFFSQVLDSLHKQLDADFKKEIAEKSITRVKAQDETSSVTRNRFTIVNRLKSDKVYPDSEIYGLFTHLFNGDSDESKDLACDLINVFYGDFQKIPKRLRESYKTTIEQSIDRTENEAIKAKMKSVLGSDWLVF